MVLTLTYLKRASAHAYGDVVIANGNFHTSGHFAFAVNEGFHDSKFGCSKSLLHINKVPKHIENFENDTYAAPITIIPPPPSLKLRYSYPFPPPFLCLARRYKHATTFLRADAIGTLTYFLQNVVNPPPELLLDNPEHYGQLLVSEGGIAAFQSLKYAGIPLLMYIRAGRANDGKLVDELHAYAYHAVST